MSRDCVSELARWSVRGLGGVVRLLVRLEADGLPFGPEEVAELRKQIGLLSAVLAKIEARAESARG